MWSSTSLAPFAARARAGILKVLSVLPPSMRMSATLSGDHSTGWAAEAASSMVCMSGRLPLRCPAAAPALRAAGADTKRAPAGRRSARLSSGASELMRTQKTKGKWARLQLIELLELSSQT